MLNTQSAPELDSLRMRRLVAHARRALPTPRRTPFAAAVLSTGTGTVIATRLNRVRALTDPTAHAEVVALRAACRRLRSISLAGHTLYTTCEPCPMCMAAALWARVDRVVYGATIDDAARHCAQIYTYSTDLVRRSDLKCAVDGPVLREACLELFENRSLQADFRRWREASATT
ncbi:MAG: nucleoside deaminase [Limisphaerales bacterium]